MDDRVPELTVVDQEIPHVSHRAIGSCRALHDVRKRLPVIRPGLLPEKAIDLVVQPDELIRPAHLHVPFPPP